MCPRCCGQDLYQTAHTEHNARNSASRRPGNRCSSALQANVPATRRRVLHCTSFRCPRSHVCFSLPAITIPPTTKKGPWFFFGCFQVFVCHNALLLNEIDRLVLDSCWIHVDFMLISFSPWISESFVQYFTSEFMLKSCWIQSAKKMHVVSLLLLSNFSTLLCNQIWFHSSWMVLAGQAKERGFTEKHRSKER